MSVGPTGGPKTGGPVPLGGPEKLETPKKSTGAEPSPATPRPVDDAAARKTERVSSYEFLGSALLARVQEAAAGMALGAGGERLDAPMDVNLGIYDPGLSLQSAFQPGGDWVPELILRNLGQVDTLDETPEASDEWRCSPSSFLAAAVMAGPEATVRLAERLAAAAKNPAARDEAIAIRGRIASGAATLGDLNRLQHIAYERFNTDGRPGLSDLEFREMQTALGAGSAAGPKRPPHVLERAERTQERLDALKPGQSVQAAIDGNGDGKPDHAVQIGRDGSGRLYAYDPGRGDGEPHLVYEDEDSDGFYDYVYPPLSVKDPESGKPVNVIVGDTVSF